MTSEDGMDWFEAVGETDPHADALEAAGASARLALYNVVRCAFDRQARKGGWNRRKLAEALRVSPEAAARLLRAPRNMTIETAARLMFVMGAQLKVSEASPAAKTFGSAAAEPSLHMERIVFTTLNFTAPKLGGQPVRLVMSNPDQSTQSEKPKIRLRNVRGMDFADITGVGSASGCYERIGDTVETIQIVDFSASPTLPSDNVTTRLLELSDDR